MHILIASPLFPPDIEDPAPYVKELAARLINNNHTITIVTYGYLPEPVHGASIISVNKQQPLFRRMEAFRKAITKNCTKCDIVFVENGPSSELPAFLASFLIHVPVVVHLGDKIALERTQKSIVRNIISKLLRIRSSEVIKNSPLPKPEILPFKPEPVQKYAKYENSWNSHIEELESIFETYAKKK